MPELRIITIKKKIHTRYLSLNTNTQIYSKPSHSSLNNKNLDTRPRRVEAGRINLDSPLSDDEANRIRTKNIISKLKIK